jgi:hypothetical protein
MAEFDKILQNFIDPTKDGLLHGASFVAVSKSGKRFGRFSNNNEVDLAV